MFDLVETATDHGQQALYEVLGGSVILALDTTRLTVVCIPGQVVHTQCSSVTKLYEFGTAVSWAGNCGFGFALAMRRSVISTYGLTAHLSSSGKRLQLTHIHFAMTFSEKNRKS